MNFLRDNEHFIVIFLVVAGMFVMAITGAPALRLGHEWVFTNHSVREVLAAIVRAL